MEYKIQNLLEINRNIFQHSEKVFDYEYIFAKLNSGNYLLPNRNGRIYTAHTVYVSCINYYRKFAEKVFKAILDDNLHEFYRLISRTGFGEKELYIVRKTNITEIPYILTDDIRVVIYSYPKYNFNKNDIIYKEGLALKYKLRNENLDKRKGNECFKSKR